MAKRRQTAAEKEELKRQKQVQRQIRKQQQKELQKQRRKEAYHERRKLRRLAKQTSHTLIIFAITI